MTQKIEKLTQKQQDRIPEFQQKWIKIGLCTDPADRPRAEAAIRKMYEIGGLQPPKEIIWCGSPLAMCLASIYYEEGEKAVKTKTEAVLTGKNPVPSEVRQILQYSIYGQHDAGWLAFYDFFREVCGLKKETEKLEGLMELGQSAGWALPYENICWVSERPAELHRDAQGRLHNTKGPALRYPDGWEIYSVHGVQVSQRIVMNPESISAKELQEERNSEVLRVIGEALGWDKFLERIGCVTIDTWIDPATQLSYELLDLKNRFGPTQPRWLRMKSPEVADGTQPTYIEKVHPELKTAQAARKWKFLSAPKGAVQYRHGDVQMIKLDDAEWDGKPLAFPTVEECNKNPKLEFAWEA